ncbi:MAG: hypothetical protein WAL59_11445 [Roseiarcus sp.]
MSSDPVIEFNRLDNMIDMRHELVRLAGHDYFRQETAVATRQNCWRGADY